MSGWKQNAGRTATERGYDPEWRRLRRVVLAEEPMCRKCGAIAMEVDHIKTVARWPELRLVRTNLQALCKPCHKTKTARDSHIYRARVARDREEHPGR
ncbi:HNH endonuclease, partial [Prosthecobacter sp.]|uniref:HNH endonuclease n=1 Tax=Prosthecobacter sp. TaxID=1965333 RepID=UPI003BB09F9C